MTMLKNTFKKIHFQYNWELVLLIISLMMSFALMIFLIVKSVVYGYEKITIFNEELNASRLVNKRFEVVYNMAANANEKYLTSIQMQERKKIYDADQLEIQKASVLKAETDIAKELCPVGTYVYLKPMCEAVQVKSLNGYQAMTHEGICFMTIDTDTWYTLSYREYQLCKRAKYGGNVNE